MALNPKQARFVNEYLIDSNATQAAIRAGYSKNRADATAYNLLRKTEIQDALNIARQELSSKSGVTPQMVIQGLADIAFSDIKDCYDENGQLKNIHDIPGPARQALAGLDVDELFEGNGENREHVGTTKKIKRWDKVKALESLAKHFGLYNADESQKTKVTVTLRDLRKEKVEADSCE